MPSLRPAFSCLPLALDALPLDLVRLPQGPLLVSREGPQRGRQFTILGAEQNYSGFTGRPTTSTPLPGLTPRSKKHFYFLLVRGSPGLEFKFVLH